MRPVVLVFFAITLCVQSAEPNRCLVDEARLLNAIAAVETRNDPAAVGRAGERGAHQLTPAINRAYHGSALAFLRSLEHDLPRVGMDGTDPYVLALGFHCGLTRLARRQISDSDADYAKRVRAVYLSK
jgi:hypothetical protein